MNINSAVAILEMTAGGRVVKANAFAATLLGETRLLDEAADGDGDGDADVLSGKEIDLVARLANVSGQREFLDHLEAALGGDPGTHSVCEALVNLPRRAGTHNSAPRLIRFQTIAPAQARTTTITEPVLTSVLMDVTHLATSRTRREVPAGEISAGQVRVELNGLTPTDSGMRSEGRFRHFFEKAPLGISLVGKDNIILQVNRKMLQMLGYEEEDMVGKRSLDFVHPEFIKTKERLVERLLEGEIASYHMEEKRHTRDGQLLWLRVTSTLIWDAAYAQMVRLNMMEDITEWKAAEEEVRAVQAKLHEITAAVPGVIYEYRLHPDGHQELLFASEGLNDIYEIDAVGRLPLIDELWALTEDDDVPGMEASIRESAENLSPWNAEFRIRTPGGELKWVRAEAVPKREPDGATTWQGLITDVTQRKEIERQLRLAKEQAEKATRAKSEFLTNVSHEIRTPMNAILGFGELLESETQNPIHRQYLKSIRSAGSTLLQLINDFLDLSQIEAGKIKLNPEPVSVVDVIEDIQSIFLIKTERKGLEFWLDVDPRLPGRLILDETRFRQLLFNLVGNAVKFTLEGYVKVRIQRKAFDQEAQTVELALTIEDTGVGIPQEEQARIFESFEQQSRQRREFGGSGLGLAICRQILRTMGGDISVSSQPGQGSIFTVELPGVRIAEGVMTDAYTSTGPQGEALPDPGEGSVMVVDENAESRSLVKGFLRKTAVQVREAASSREALAELYDNPPNVLLLDLRLPILSGAELADALATDEVLKTVPVVVLTSGGDSEEFSRLKEINLEGYLRKPISKRELFKLLSKLLPSREEGSLVEEDFGVEMPDLEGPPPEEFHHVGDALSASLPEGATADPEGLKLAAEELGELLTERLERLERAPDIDEIERFGGRVRQIGTDSGVREVTTWGNDFLNAAESFDVQRINEMLAGMRQFYERLRSAMESTSNIANLPPTAASKSAKL